MWSCRSAPVPRRAIAANEIQMRAGRLHPVRDRLLYPAQFRSQLVRRQLISSGVIGVGRNILADKDGEPALLLEQATFIFRHDRPASERIDFILQAIGPCHLPHIAPQLAVIALVGDIMQHQEVPDPLELQIHKTIILVVITIRAGAIREERNQVHNPALNQIDAGRFQRLEKPTGQANRDTVFIPQFPPFAGQEEKLLRISQGLPFQILHQRIDGVLVTDIAIAIDMAVADPVLQRNAPLPATHARRCASVRTDRACDRTVVHQADLVQ